MKVMMSTLCGLLLLGLSHAALATAPADAGANSTIYTTLAAKAQAAGQAETTLFFQEQALDARVGQPAAFGAAAGRYWQSISQHEDWSRAYNFFYRLAIQHPDDPDVLANYGGAIGRVLGKLGAGGYGSDFPFELHQELETKASKAFSHALSIQPDNFGALLGQATMYAYTPGGLAKAEPVFEHILSLRQSQPQHAYAIVYEMWAGALAHVGQQAEAKKVMEKGKAALGAAAFSKRPSTRH